MNLHQLLTGRMPEIPTYHKSGHFNAFFGLSAQVDDSHKPRVDHKNKIIYGYVVAQEGHFKSHGRGQFTLEGLQRIVTLINAEKKGLKVRFTHPSLSEDGLGKFLGRATNARIDEVIDHRQQLVRCVRADLHFNSTSFKEPPNGGRPLGPYVMELADTDPDALSSSLAIRELEQREVLNEDGTRKKDEAGNTLPPIWIPLALHASDIVDTGDAVDGLLSAELPDAAVREGCALLNRVFSDEPIEVVKSRLEAWTKRYLQYREHLLSRHDKKSETIIYWDADPERQILSTDLTISKGDSMDKLTEQQLLDKVKTLESQLHEAQEANKVLEKARDHYAGQFEETTKELKSINSRLDKAEIEAIFKSAELENKIKSGEYGELLDLATQLKPNKVQFDRFIASLKARPDVIDDLKEVSGGVGAGMDKPPADSWEATQRIAAEEKINLQTNDGQLKAENLAKQRWPDLNWEAQ